MKQWNGTWNLDINKELSHWCEPEQTLLFDIETTGFSAKNTMLYMIGFAYIQNGIWNYQILFNDDGRSEHAILTVFLGFLKNYHTIIHYNGDGFDVPYLIEKRHQYESLGLPVPEAESLSACTSLDLYKIIKPYRAGLAVSNLKLPTIEQALGIKRNDSNSGGELIRVYKKYLNQPDAASEHLLYQHNYEDILAMVPMLALLNFQGLQEHDWSVTNVATEAEHIILQLQLTHPLPLRYLFTNSYYCFNGYQTDAVITIPLVQEELKYYLTDWKNYYYLPLEDKVIHKSIAAYVDSTCKEKAKKTNAYIKKTGCFLPFPAQLANQPCSPVEHLYKRSHTDSISYAEASDLNIVSPEFWLEYLKYV